VWRTISHRGQKAISFQRFGYGSTKIGGNGSGSLPSQLQVLPPRSPCRPLSGTSDRLPLVFTTVLSVTARGDRLPLLRGLPRMCMPPATVGVCLIRVEGATHPVRTRDLRQCREGAGITRGLARRRPSGARRLRACRLTGVPLHRLRLGGLAPRRFIGTLRRPSFLLRNRRHRVTLDSMLAIIQQRLLRLRHRRHHRGLLAR
jgi:hypothetical protein